MPIERTIIMHKDEINNKIELLNNSAKLTLENIGGILGDIRSPIKKFQLLKFNQVGCDPLDINIKLNLMEQLNQAFTYMASFHAAQYIFEKHNSEVDFITLNLGTQGGSDIESSDKLIVGEVFATTNIRNNDKLNKDIAKVKAVEHAKHRYVFFIAPSIKSGCYLYKPKKIDLDGVKIISLSEIEQDVQFPFISKE
ncbi:MAG: hypothetical protein WCI59_20110 [Betaproteobacteria bacterium]